MSVKSYFLPLKILVTWVLFCGISVSVMALEKAIVEKVFDGDTILLSDGRTVRLIGVDTPEMHDSEKLERDVRRSGKSKETIQLMGLQSFNFVDNLVSGQKIQLEYDILNSTTKNQDKYGRTLAYVKFYCKHAPGELKKYMSKKGIKKFKSDWISLNALIIQCGYGHAYTRYPFKYREEFIQFEKEARQYEIGLWAGIPDAEDDHEMDRGILLSHAPAVMEKILDHFRTSAVLTAGDLGKISQELKHHERESEKESIDN